MRHDLELHYLLAYRNVGLGDVNLHFRVIDLICQAIPDHLREVPETAGNGFKDSCLVPVHVVRISGEGGLPGSVHSVPALVLSPDPSGHSVAAHQPWKGNPVWPHVLQLGGYLCHLAVGKKTQD